MGAGSRPTKPARQVLHRIGLSDRARLRRNVLLARNVKPKPPPIDRRTCRPHDAYPKAEPRPQPYVDQFSRALGLKPTPTLFGKTKVNL